MPGTAGHQYRHAAKTFRASPGSGLVARIEAIEFAQ
jgi:hypothetical protein